MATFRRKNHEKFLALLLAMLMSTAIIPVGMTALAETATSWAIEDFETTADCSISGLTNKVTETVDGFKAVTGTSTGIHFSKSINPAISIQEYEKDYLALNLKLYIGDPTKLKTAGSPQIELTSSGKCDVNELHWSLTTLNLQAGWNDLTLDFSQGVATGGTLDITNINYVRIYANFSAEIKAGFGPLTIVPTHGGATFDGSFAVVKEGLTAPPQTAEGWFKPNNYNQNEWLISDFDGTDAIPVTDSGTNTKGYTVDSGATVLSCEVPANQWISLRHETLPSTAGIALPSGYGMNELGLALRVYIEDVAAIKSANIELSNTRMDTNEIWWNLEGINAVQPLQNGWNELVLPFNSYSGKTGGEFSVSQIKWWRFNFNNTADGTNVYKMDYLKIIPMRKNDNLMFTDFDNTDALAITDSCGSNTKTYTTENGATILNIDTAGGQWFSLRQEGLPSTAGIALPEGYTMDELAVAVRVYIEDVTHIKAANLELANTRMDTNEIWWNLAGINKVQALQNGWNELVLPFSSYTGNTNGEFTLTQIKWWRFNFDNIADGGNVYKLDYIKVLPLVEKGEPSDETTPEQRNYLFSYTDTADNSHGLFADQNGVLNWLDGNGTVNLGAYLAPKEWSHVAYTLDPASKTLQVYLNGQLAAVKQLTAAQPAAGTFRIGIGPDGFDGLVFSGKIGDVRVWNDVRTDEEITANYDVLINNPTDGLYANWRLNEDMGFIAVVPQDKVGTNHASVLWRDWSDDWIPYEEPTDYDYTFVAVPDPQILAASYPDVYYKLFQYIADNAESQNIEYVLGLGDLTNSNSDAEWKVARNAFDLIEGKVPYANVLGNHDYGDWTKPYRDTTRYNTYFKYDDHASRSDWGGAYEQDSMDNVYYLFEVGNVPYMVICLEFLPRDGVLNWANKAVADHPDRNVIVLTHGYIDGASGNIGSKPQSDYGFIINNPESYNDGQKIWEKFISQHENIKMSLCGHTFCKDDNVIMRADAGVNGNTVVQLCLNAQTMDEAYFEKTGVGMLGLLRFSENGQKVALQYYSPHTELCFREVNQLSFALDNIITLSPDSVAANIVIDQIDALTGEDTDAIAAARDAYNALTDDQKKLVTNLSKLEALEKIEPPAPIASAYGDVNGDDAVDAKDALMILQAAVDKITLTEEQTVKADVNGDKAIDAKDALLVLQKAVDKIEKFPVER